MRQRGNWKNRTTNWYREYNRQMGQAERLGQDTSRFSAHAPLNNLDLAQKDTNMEHYNDEV